MAEQIDPRIERLLTDFKDTQSVSNAERAAFRRAITESPYLRQLIETTLDRGVLKGFTAQATPGAGGHFSDQDGRLNISRSTLSQALTQPDGIDLLVGTIAHEAAHAANQADRQLRLKQFERQLDDRFGSVDEVHDATEIALKLQHSQRRDEAYAELLSVNAVVSRIQHLTPSVKNEELLERVQQGSLCVVHDPKANALRWAEGITLNAEGRIAYTPENIEAIARCHFDATPSQVRLGANHDLDYRNYYAPYSMGRIADHKIDADNATANPLSDPDPPLHLNLGRLGWDLAKIERDGVSFANHKIDLNFYDTTSGTPVMRNLRDTTTDASRTIAPPDLNASATSVEPTSPTPSDPRSPTHPDHALYRQAQQGVAGLDASLGHPPDAHSERLAASLAALAKAQGLSRIDHVLLSQGGAGLKPGETVFIVEGRVDDPAHQRAQMPIERAAKTPMEASFDQLKATNQALQAEPSHVQERDLHLLLHQGMSR